MTPKRIAPAGLISVGFQTITLSNSTAQALNSTCRLASVIDFSVETNDARMRADGTNPTLTTGVLYKKDLTYRFEGNPNSANFKFQRTTGTSKISVQAWRYAGGDR
jgi:hypothetical protein